MAGVNISSHTTQSISAGLLNAGKSCAHLSLISFAIFNPWKGVFGVAAYSVRLFHRLGGSSSNLCSGTTVAVAKRLLSLFKYHPLRKGDREPSFVGRWRIEQL